MALKRRYKRKLLHRLIIEDENGASIVEFLKFVNMKVVVELISEAWQEISAATLRKSWRKIVPIPPSESSPDQELEMPASEDAKEDFVREFGEIGFSLNEEDVRNWLESDSSDPGFQLMTDDEICSHVMQEELTTNEEEEDDADVQFICPITNSEAAHMGRTSTRGKHIQFVHIKRATCTRSQKTKPVNEANHLNRAISSHT